MGYLLLRARRQFWGCFGGMPKSVAVFFPQNQKRGSVDHNEVGDETPVEALTDVLRGQSRSRQYLEQNFPTLTESRGSI